MQKCTYVWLSQMFGIVGGNMAKILKPLTLEEFRDYVSITEQIVEKWWKEGVFKVGHNKGVIFQHLLILLVNKQIQDKRPIELIRGEFEDDLKTEESKGTNEDDSNKKTM